MNSEQIEQFLDLQRRLLCRLMEIGPNGCVKQAIQEFATEIGPSELRQVLRLALKFRSGKLVNKE